MPQVRSKDQLANMLTKALLSQALNGSQQDRHERHLRSKLGGVLQFGDSLQAGVLV